MHSWHQQDVSQKGFPRPVPLNVPGFANLGSSERDPTSLLKQAVFEDLRYPVGYSKCCRDPVARSKCLEFEISQVDAHDL